MIKRIIIILVVTAVTGLQTAKAQYEQYEYIQQGEFGFTLGAAHYFGDLNHGAGINRPKLAMGVFFRKQFGNYTALRISGHYARLGYSDIYSKNEFQLRRNLSFNTDVYEVAVQGDFNFFKFIPTDRDHKFTPYITFGVGVFTYDPYAFYKGQKIFLRPLNTEGETFYKNRKAYGSMATCFPIGGGIKFSVAENLNVSLELTHRFTSTDYLDDVSTTYVGINKFPSPVGTASFASILQDRSFETGTPIGVEGRQRGWSKQKDQYIIAEIGITYNISSYRCPSAKQ